MKKIIVGLLYVLLLGCTHARLPFTTTTDSYSSWRDSTGVPLHAVYGTVGYKIDETAYASWLYRTYAGLRYHPDSLGVIPVYYFIPDSIELTVSCNKMVSDIKRLDSVQLVHLFQHHFTGNFPIYSGEDDIGYYLWAMDTLKDQIRCLVLEHFGVCGHGDQIIYLEYSSDGTLQHMANNVACAYASPYNEAYCNAVWNGHTWVRTEREYSHDGFARGHLQFFRQDSLVLEFVRAEQVEMKCDTIYQHTWPLITGDDSYSY